MSEEKNTANSDATQTLNEDTQEDTQTHENTDDRPEDGGKATVTETAEAVASSDDGEGFEQEMAKLREEAQKNLEGWQRSRAEFTNYKKRVQKELAEASQKSALDTLTKILPIIDDFERAIENIPDDIAENPWVSGTALIMKKFEKLMEEHDIRILDPVGEPFNPREHEAIGMEDSDDYESGIVTTTLQKGFISGERVLRPALVKVAN